MGGVVAASAQRVGVAEFGNPFERVVRVGLLECGGTLGYMSSF